MRIRFPHLNLSSEQVSSELNAIAAIRNLEGIQFRSTTPAVGQPLADPVTIAIIAGTATVISALISACAVYVSTKAKTKPSDPAPIIVTVLLRGPKGSLGMEVSVDSQSQVKLDSKQLAQIETKCGEIAEISATEKKS